MKDNSIFKSYVKRKSAFSIQKKRWKRLKNFKMRSLSTYHDCSQKYLKLKLVFLYPSHQGAQSPLSIFKNVRINKTRARNILFHLINWVSSCGCFFHFTIVAMFSLSMKDCNVFQGLTDTQVRVGSKWIVKDFF